MEDSGMKLCYLVVDECGQLRRVQRAQIEGLWRGTLRAEDLGAAAANELRLVSVLRDSNLQAKKIFLLRLPLSSGLFTRENYLTLRIFSMPDCVTPREVVQHHTDGWPRDFFRQLAVVLDTPIAQLNVPLGIGGPLLMAAALRTSPRKALKFLK
jgi:hypothetical protein